MAEEGFPSIGVDIGGTKVLAGAVTADGEIVEVVRLPTPHRSTSPRVVEDTIVAAVSELQRATSHPARAVGVGAAGFVDVEGSVAFAPHLSWRREPLQSRLEHRLSVPVRVDNDANTTARAELRFGAARAYRNVLCLTLGTGIGGALVLDRHVVRGSHGMAGEFGHMQVVPDGRACQCGNRGCWEQYCSGNALLLEARERLAARPAETSRLRKLVDQRAGRLDGPTVTRAAETGDAASAEMLAEVGTWLGVGVAGLCAAFDPELVIVGGGLSEAGDLLLEPAREALARRLPGAGFRPVPVLTRAALGSNAGFVGAADLERDLGNCDN